MEFGDTSSIPETVSVVASQSQVNLDDFGDDSSCSDDDSAQGLSDEESNQVSRRAI